MNFCFKYIFLFSIFNLMVPLSFGGDDLALLKYRDALILSHYKIMLKVIKNPEIVSALEEAVHKETSLKAIVLKDLHWKKDGKTRSKITSNSVSKLFEKLIGNSKTSFSEFMLTDSFGSLLASFPVTSDYWQGDERKFIEPIKRQGLYISDPNWDESTNVYSFF